MLGPIDRPSPYALNPCTDLSNFGNPVLISALVEGMKLLCDGRRPAVFCLFPLLAWNAWHILPVMSQVPSDCASLPQCGVQGVCTDNYCCSGSQSVCGSRSVCQGVQSTCGDNSLCSGSQSTCGTQSTCTGTQSTCTSSGNSGGSPTQGSGSGSGTGSGSGLSSCIYYGCPPSYVQNSHAITSVGISQQVCWSCCCDPVCSVYSCPSGTLQKSNAASIGGKSQEACCDTACSSYSCPAGELQKAGAGSIPGQSTGDCCDASCSLYSGCTGGLKIANAGAVVGSDSSTCCLICASFTCPNGFLLKAGASNIIGNTQTLCCDKACSSYSCPTGWFQTSAGAGQSTNGCCSQSCSLYSCPSGTLLKRSAASIVGSNHSACCDEACSSYKCPPSWVLQKGASQIAGSSRSTCCIESLAFVIELSKGIISTSGDAAFYPVWKIEDATQCLTTDLGISNCPWASRPFAGADSASQSVTTSSLSTANSQISKQYGLDASGSGEARGVSGTLMFSHSEASSKATQTLESAGSYFAWVHKKKITHKISASGTQGQLTETFLTQVNRLSTSSPYHAWASFFDNFGTHFIAEADVGGFVEFFYSVFSETCYAYSSSDAQSCFGIGVSAALIKGPAQGGLNFSTCSGSMSQNSLTKSNTKTSFTSTVRGGDQAVFDSSGWRDFAATVQDSNAEIWNTQLNPIWNLFLLVPSVDPSLSEAAHANYLKFIVDPERVQQIAETPTLQCKAKDSSSSFPAGGRGCLWQKVILMLQTALLLHNS